MNQLLQNSLREQAERRPEAIALVTREQRITYGQLEECTNQLARLLHAAGCQRGDRICFAIPKSPAAIIAILGILKADCLHVPIDTASPAPRVAKILASTQPRYILAVGSTTKLIDELLGRESSCGSISVGCMESRPPAAKNFTPNFCQDDLQSYSAEPLACRNSEQDPAHILFTSGSTGEPKGVVITHSNVIHFLKWATKYFGIRSSDRISCHPPLHFDLAYFDIFGAFAEGAELHLVPPELSLLPNKLADFIRVSELTQWFSVPSVLNYMAKFDVVKFNHFPALKRLLWCGEVLPKPTLIYWMKRLPNVTFTNLYGPTEATIASSYYTLPGCPIDDQAPIPIGIACDGEELLVLDEELQPLPPGEVGQLYIRGGGLSPGYWRDPEKTAAAFMRTGGGHRLYKTGDLARIGEDGLVYFLGRLDSQVKSRGYRIELGEIEASLNTVDGLKEAAVVAIPSDSFEENIICCAYVPLDAACNLNVVLHSKLSRLLPRYMLPARWLPLERLPTNANNKIDRRKLREMFAVQNKVDAPSLQVDRDSAPSHDAAGFFDLRRQSEPNVAAKPTERNTV
jgi:amino acid adenylation domain-containing protein